MNNNIEFFSNVLYKDPVVLSLRDREIFIILYDIKPPKVNDLILKVQESYGNLYQVKLSGVIDVFGRINFTCFGYYLTFFSNKVQWVRFDENLKSELLSRLLKAHQSGKIEIDQWIYCIIGNVNILNIEDN
jgi:hypothetical protein